MLFTSNEVKYRRGKSKQNINYTSPHHNHTRPFFVRILCLFRQWHEHESLKQQFWQQVMTLSREWATKRLSPKVTPWWPQPSHYKKQVGVCTYLLLQGLDEEGHIAEWVDAKRPSAEGNRAHCHYPIMYSSTTMPPEEPGCEYGCAYVYVHTVREEKTTEQSLKLTSSVPALHILA